MEIIFLLIPVSLLLIVIIVAILFWAVRSGQYDDLEAPRHRILMDDDGINDVLDEENGNSALEQGINGDASTASSVKSDQN